MERRFDPVTGEWRMFAGHRQDRTFLPAAEFCPLCPTRDCHPPTEGAIKHAGLTGPGDPHRG